MWPTAIRCAFSESAACSIKSYRIRGRIFDRQVSCTRVPFDVISFHSDSEVQTRGEVTAEGLVPVRRRPQLVIQMRDAGHFEAAVFGEIEEEQEEGNRVGAARETDQHTHAWLNERMALNGFSDALMKACQQVPSSKLQESKFQEAPTGSGWNLELGAWILRAWICRRADSNCRPRAYETRALTG